MSAPDFFDQLLALDARLAQHGFPALSRFWRRALKAFYRSGARRFVVRVGRRGGKSLTWAKVAVATALVGAWQVPPGEVGVVAFLSVDRVEAAARLRTIVAMLDALEVRYTRRGDEIELEARPVVFRVVTASLSGVVGFTCVLAVADEIAKWKDADTGANPAKEIVASLAPTTATQPTARLILSSSPWSTFDYHATSFDAGDSNHQRVAHAPTWEANPSIMEADTRALEPDARTWSREYAAIPGDTLTSICSADELRLCTVAGLKKRAPIAGGEYLILVDAAFRNDRFVTMVAHHEMREAASGHIEDVVVVDAIVILAPSLLRRIKPEDGIRAIAALATEYRVTHNIWCDQHNFDALHALALERGVVLRQMPSSAAQTSARVRDLQTRLAQRTVSLISHPEMEKELLQAQLELHQGGRVTLRAPAGRHHHDDTVSALLLACDPDHGAVRLPASDGEIVVRCDPFFWMPESGELGGGTARYFRKLPGGGLAAAEPAYGSPAFADHARELAAEGTFTPATTRWIREQPEDVQRDLLPAGMPAFTE